MNLNLLSTSFLFIGPNLNNSSSYYKKRNTNNLGGLNPNISGGFQFPSSKYFKQYQIHESFPNLNKNSKNVPDLVNYIGLGNTFTDSVKIPISNDVFLSVCSSKPLISTLSRVFKKEDFSRLNEYQISLFDELSLGIDVILHSYTSSGKTFAILLYMALRYYYQLDPHCLNSVVFSEIMTRINSYEGDRTLKFERKVTPLNRRVLVLCPTKELAVQCAKQLVNFTDGDEDSVELIIDEHNLCPKIKSENVFIVGSSNQVESYLLNKDKRHTRSILQSVYHIFLDEMDRLIRVPNQHAPDKKKRLLNENPGSAYNICQSLLSISPNKLRVVCASASVSRNHIRKINSLIQLYRNVRDNLTAVIRKKINATETGRYVSIPETVKHFYCISSNESQESKIKCLVEILKKDEGIPMIFLSSGSLLTLQKELKRYNIECKIFHHELGIKDVNGKINIKEGSNQALNMIENLHRSIKDNKYNHVLAASTDSARGIHLKMLDSVYIVGRPRNVNEYIHISGRVGRCSRNGRCITIDSEDNIKILLSWQNQINTRILQIFDQNHPSVLNINPNIFEIDQSK